MAIIHVMGRPTSDPVMKQGKTSGAEYVSLDIATSQRSQNPQDSNGNETLFVTCYFSKYLAERLIKANVKKGTCLYLYGDVEIHPFIYNQGARAGQPGAGVKMNVKDWQFCLSNKSEAEAGAAPNGNPSINGMANGGGAATPGAGGGQNPNMAAPTNPGGQMMNAAGMQGMAGMQAGMSVQNPAMANGMMNPQIGFQHPGAMTANTMTQVTGFANGFASVPEGMASQLPFPN